ncbi:S41 family peptidase [Pedobacter changchengzhani]|uniref:S41 family peptidase n=1 Tax=Pedobacter changchengzhani TaxID=2529274 RepID=A0A4R5MJK8_9SPHI|nr:S41 family peptidase [Pedobacter changchengzhani]TDG35375.1 S41 family peptidase [Pedobacter changchengzhani]
MKKNTRYNLIIAFTYAAVLTLGMFVGIKFIKMQGFDIQKNTKYVDNNGEKLDEILHIINKKYVDDINTDSLHNLPIDSVLHQLDPHSVYLPPADVDDMTNTLEGNFEGVGLEYYMLNDTMMVTGVVKDGPAFMAGIKLGDKILSIDSAVVSGKNLPKAQLSGRFKGKAGTGVNVLLLRTGSLQPRRLMVTRGKVNVSSIDAAYLIAAETGYVRISKFGANTDEDFANAINNLKAKGMKKLILDLRDNGGGYFSAATGLADQFLAENKLIVYTEGKHEPRTDYFASGTGAFLQGKLAVLINENTASASEIVAGAIQDLGRGIIVGRRSFGKGLVQEQFAFNDGSALNLTIARYFTPSGRSIQKSYKKGYDAYKHELDDRMADGELTADRTSFQDSVEKTEGVNPSSVKTQKTAGGIQPDVFVKLDTTGYNKFYGKLVIKKILSDFVFDVLTTRYSSSFIEQNINTFNISDNDFKDFATYLQNKKITVDHTQLNSAKMHIAVDLKAFLCRYYLGDVGYYKAVNQTDNVVKQALINLQ